MSRNTLITHITLWVNRVVGLIVIVLLPTFPLLLRWYSDLRPLLSTAQASLMTAFYVCALITLLALWNVDCLLRCILSEQIFTEKNVRHIGIVRWCCAAISLVCIPAAFFYPPLLFMVVIMAFLALIVTVLVRVMRAAVEIREENDLTI